MFHVLVLISINALYYFVLRVRFTFIYYLYQVSQLIFSGESAGPCLSFPSRVVIHCTPLPPRCCGFQTALYKYHCSSISVTLLASYRSLLVRSSSLVLVFALVLSLKCSSRACFEHWSSLSCVILKYFSVLERISCTTVYHLQVYVGATIQ